MPKNSRKKARQPDPHICKFKRLEPNLMEHHLCPESNMFKVMDFLRAYFKENYEHGTFPRTYIEGAKQEWMLKLKELDESSPDYRQDMNSHIFSDLYTKYKEEQIAAGNKDYIKDINKFIRPILVIEGELSGTSGPVEAAIPIDISDKIYKYFNFPRHSEHSPMEGSDKKTLDELITGGITAKFLKEHREKLIELGYDSFEIFSSRFFYIAEPKLEPFKEDNTIDMVKLIPYLLKTDYVISPNNQGLIHQVSPPSIQDYRKNAPTPHVSYRLKKSLANKLFGRLSKTRLSKIQAIADIEAGRDVEDNMERVLEIEKYLKTNPQIGNTKIEYIETKDYYKNPKPNGFKSKNIKINTQTRRCEECIREFQIQDLDTYYNNEIIGETSHKRDQERIMQLAPIKRKLADIYREKVMERIFGKPTMTINFYY